MGRIDVNTLVEQTSEVLAAGGPDTDQAGRNLPLSGADVFVLIAEKVVIPIIVAVCGKLLGDVFTRQKPIDSVAALQAAIDTVQLPRSNIVAAERGEIVAATASRLQGFGYAHDQANLLAESILSKVENAFAMGAASANSKSA